MRMHLKILLPFLLMLAAGGCGRENLLTPTRQISSGSADLVVLNLPAPGSEAASISPTDRAAFDRASLAPARQPAGDANVVVFWNRLTRELGTGAPPLPPPALARAYALVQVGIYEALVVSGDKRRGSLPEHAVAAGVASSVLGYLFPSRLARIEEATAEQLALDGGASGSALGGWALGRAVGRAVVARASSDGSATPYTGTPPTGDGIWTGTNPVLPMCGTWRTWVLKSGSEVEPEPPYAFGSAQDLADVQEVLDVSLNRTPEQIAIVHKWADVSPPAIWNELLNTRIESLHLGLAEAARVHAYLNMAMADAFIECWACKYAYWTARPFQRIPGLVTVITTPNFPTYTSGHSTISAAAAAVLGEVFPAERDYFVQQSEEAAMSRLYGGIHFRHDNEEGTRVGRIIGERVVERMRAAGGNLLTER
jgi:PAP2 superfamily protein